MGSDRRVGFITSGPAYMHVRESFPAAPVFKLGFSYPLPFARLRAFAEQCERIVVVEEVEPLIESELKAQGIAVIGKDILPLSGELSPQVLKPAIARLLGEPEPPAAPTPALPVFPRPPTMCVACPHLGVYYTLSQLRNVTISGDIGCYTRAISAATRSASASHGTHSTRAFRWAPRWAWRCASIKGAATPKRARRSSP